MNFDINKAQSGEIVLKSHVYKDFVKPIYDIAGSRELGSGSILHIATPLDCLESNMLLQPYIIGNDENGTQTGWPQETQGERFSCITEQETLATPISDYSTYLNNLPTENCTTSKLELDGATVREVTDDTCEFINKIKVYSFKTLTGSSIMEHKSPTDEEYGIEL